MSASTHDEALAGDSAGEGARLASAELMPLVYEELRRLAAARMSREAAGHTLQPTALVHEAWLRLAENGSQSWENRAHFFGAASESMRRILIERARRKARLKHGGGQERLNIDDLELAGAMTDEKLLLVDEGLQRLMEEEPETARVVTLKFFGGLPHEEIAEITGTSERTVRRQWVYAKAWLFDYVSRLL